MRKLGRILKYIKPYWLRLAGSIIATILGTLFSLFSFSMIIPVLNILFKSGGGVTELKPFEFNSESISNVFGYYVTKFIELYNESTALMMICLITIGLMLFKNMFLYLSMYFMAPARNYAVRDIRNMMFQKILELPLGYFTEERKGDIMSKLTNDINEVEVSIFRSLDLLFKAPIMIIFFFTALIILSAKLTLFVFIFLPIAAGLIGFIGNALKRKSKESQKVLGGLLSVIEEVIGGLRVIKAFNAEHQSLNFFKDMNQRFTKLMNSIWLRRSLASPLSEFLAIITVSVVIWYGGKMVFETSFDSEILIGYLVVFSQLISPIKLLSTAYYSVLRGAASVDRLESILDEENPICDKANAISIKGFNDKIEFKNVSFKYDKDYVLKNINLKIEKGKTIALVGKSGSGKTTLVDLLPRFYDIEEGEILLDGRNIKDYKIKDLRSLMGNVNQEPILFNDTFYNNIGFGLKDVDQDKVKSAALVANAEVFINQTKDGYNTNIGDRGSKLSGGQRQRISIARAIMANPPIMILDEATSALDTENERLVQDALEKLMENRTSIVIAHRLSTVIHADEICVMDEGRIIERGTHAELLEKGEVYKKLHEMQMFE